MPLKLPKAFATAISKRARVAPGYACKLGQKLTIANPGSSSLGVDEKRMSARFVVTSEEPDRVGDVIETAGIYLKNFANNPACPFGHQSIILPVGKWEDESGTCTIVPEPGNKPFPRTVGEVFFSQRSPEAAQVFNLVVEKIIRATSIGFNPLVDPIRRGDDESNPWSLYPGFRFPRIDLLEVSLVVVPAHPGATNSALFASQVRGILSRGKLAGATILEPIRKSLEPLAEKSKPLARSGFELKKGKTMKIMTPKQWLAAMPKAFKAAYQKRDRRAKMALGRQAWKKLKAMLPKLTKLRKDEEEDESHEPGEVMPYIKDHIRAVAAKHLKDEEGNERSPHDFFAKPRDEEEGTYKVYHHHDEDAEAEHLKAVKDDLLEEPKIKEVEQSDKPRQDGEGYIEVFPDVEEEPAKELRASGRMVKWLISLLPPNMRQKASDCVANKIPKLIDEGYDQDQAVAIAFSMCGESREMDEDEEEIKDEEEIGDEYGMGPGTEEEDEGQGAGTPHGVEVWSAVIEFLSGELERAEPEVAEGIRDVLEMATEIANERYPDEEFGGEVEPANKPSQEAEEEETEEVLDAYRRGKPKKTKKTAKIGDRKARVAAARLKRMHKRGLGIMRDATEHLGDMAEMEPGEEYTRTMKAACKMHHREMSSLVKELEGPGEEEGDGKSADKGLQVLADAVVGLDKRMSEVGNGLHSITGK
jgi:hypothetical protein